MRACTWALVWLAGAGTAMAAGSGSIRPDRLRCEYRVEPLGVTAAAPRLSWVCEAVDPAERGLTQTAYQVLVSSSEARLAAGEADLWDSGRVASGETLGIAYGGRPLAARRQVWWKVRVWDQEGLASAWSPSSNWTMAILEPADWQARWIAAPDAATMPLFRRDVPVRPGLRRAVVRVCGLGHYALSVNGAAVHETFLDPGWTNYRATCPYDSYDITGMLRTGPNALGAMLGNGMYNVVGGRYVKFTGSFGPPKLILEVTLEYGDGRREIVGTDGAWSTTDGPIVFSCTYGGEDYDARRAIEGWDLPGGGDAPWRAATVVEGPGGVLRPRCEPPVGVHETLEPVAVRRLREGVYVYDMGRNCSAVPRIAVRGEAGRTVRLVPGELVSEDGSVTQASSGQPVWFEYTLAGRAVEQWNPRFSYYGYRYLQVEGAAPAEATDAPADLPRVASLESLFLCLEAPEVGRFECSSPEIGRIRDLILTAMRSNLKSVLTDCPHREKLGWLECSYLLQEALTPNWDLATYYEKIARDTVEAQTAEGLVPDIAPEYVVFSGGFRDSPEWGSAAVLAPWGAYLLYGDERILAGSYETMKRYVAYLGSKSSGHIVNHGLGDWYDVGPAGNGPSQLTSIALTATALYYQDIVTLERVARVLGKAEDVESYRRLAEEVRAAFNTAFLHADEGAYDRNSQTANSMALVLGLAPEERREAVLESLVAGIRANGNRVTAGDIGFAYVVRALTDAGRGDVLFDMILQDEGPGYLHQLRMGATSLIEAWDANRGASQNHCMLGHAEEWFHRGAAGIRLDEEGGAFRRFTLRPQPVAGLTSARERYDSVRGTIESAWQVVEGRFAWEISVPANTVATVWVPAPALGAVSEGGRPAVSAPGLTFLRQEAGCVVFHASSGRYRFEVAGP